MKSAQPDLVQIQTCLARSRGSVSDLAELSLVLD